MGLTPVFGVKRKCTVLRCDDVDEVIEAVLEYTKKKLGKPISHELYT